MNVLVLLATVADTRFPLSAQRFTAFGHLENGAHPRMLSPFDEAALETALKLRDAQAETRISIALLEFGQGDAVARAVAAHRPDTLVRIEPSTLALYDAAAASEVLAQIARSVEAGQDLVFLGREFGDADDGALGAALAERLQFRYVSLAQALVMHEGSPCALRERGRFEELHPLAPGMVVSVTNDRRSRLRHPLFKNVAMAKRAPLPGVVAAPAGPQSSVALAELALAPAMTRAVACRYLEGPPAAQATALVAYLESAIRE